MSRALTQLVGLLGLVALIVPGPRSLSDGAVALNERPGRLNQSARLAGDESRRP